MESRVIGTLLLLACAALVVSVCRTFVRGPNMNPPANLEDWDHRVRFVCCDDHGRYSSGVYMRVGGGKGAFDTVRKAAPFMRAGDTGSAAAGLCGFLFKQVRYDGDTGGTLSVDPPPVRGPDGSIDWKAYGGDSDIILINVDQGTARCVFGQMLGQEIHDLPLGGRKVKRR